MARPLLVLSGPMVMGCVTWQAICGSGRLPSMEVISTRAVTVGAVTITMPLSRSGATAIRRTRAWT